MTEGDVTIKRYVGFYLVEGLWADNKPDYNKFSLSKFMEEAVVAITQGNREIIIYRDGLIAYSDSELSAAGMAVGPKTLQRMEKYSEIVNALAVILISTITKELGVKFHTHFEITHHDITAMTFKNDQFQGMSIPLGNITASQLNKRFRSITPPPDDIDDLRRPIVPKQVLEFAVETFFAVVKEPGSIRLLARANKAAAEFAGMSFSDSILISWLSIETRLYEKLRKYMNNEGSTRFNRERKDYVSKEFTVSEVIELLEFSKIISKDEYELLHAIRKIRNKIVHKGYSAAIEDASKTLKLLESIIDEKTGKTIPLYAGMTMQMF